MAEQLALRQRLGQGGAVDLHQRLLAPRREPVQPAREQLLAHAGLAQQQHRQVALGHRAAFLEQLAHRLAVRGDLPVGIGRHGQCRGVLLGPHRPVAAVAQGVVLALQAGHAHGGLHPQRGLAQRGVGGGVEAPGRQAVQRQHAPGALVLHQADAHAVVHRQGLALARIDQAVVGVRQAAALLEGHHLGAGQDGRQPRLLVQAEAPSQRIAHQPHRGQRAQAVRRFARLQRQQRHCIAVEGTAQVVDHVLQPHRRRQPDRQVAQQVGLSHGENYLTGSMIP